MEKRLVTLGQLWGALDLGPLPPQLPQAEVLQGLAEPHKVLPGTLVFVGNENFLKKIQWEPKAFYFVDEKLSPEAPLKDAGNCFKIKHAMVAMARASQLFANESAPLKGTHPTAALAGSVSLGANVKIGAFVSVGENTIIGDGVVLHPGVRVGAGVRIGADSVLFPNVVIYDHCRLGERVRIHAGSVIGADGFGYAQKFSPSGVEHIKIAHTGTVLIGDDVEIGASTSIDRGTLGETVIGRGSKIDNQVQIGHNCQIGEGVIICGSTGIAGSTKVGPFAVLAGFVGVGHGTKIGAGTTIAGFSMVFGEIPAKETWGGVPARPLRESLKLQAYIARLPDLFKSLKAEKRGKSHD